MNGHSVLPLPLPESPQSPSVNPEVALHQRENVASTSFDEEKSAMPSGEWVESDLQERIKQQLYLANFSKDVFRLQLDEQSDLQMEFNHQRKQLLDEMSIASTLVSEVQGKNESLGEELAKCKSELQAAVCAKEELEKQFYTAKVAVEEISIRADELHVELERSHGELSSLSVELANCRALLAALEVENDNLNGNLTSAVLGKKELAEEKGYLVRENEKLLTGLAECEGSITSLLVENVNLSCCLAITTDERNNLVEVKEDFVRENEKLLTAVAECKVQLEVLQGENAKLNGSLGALMEERNMLGEEKDYLVTENEKLWMDLKECKRLMASLQVEHCKAVDDLKEATLRLELLNKENIMVSPRSGEAVNQVEVFGMPGRDSEGTASGDDTNRLPWEGETEHFSPRLRKPDEGLVDGSPVEQIKLDVCDHSSGFTDFKGHLEEAEKIIQKLENAIEVLHSHSVSLSKSGGKGVAPAVSKLIQAFESKAHHDDHDIEQAPLTENQPLTDQFLLTQELARNLRALLKESLLNAENLHELFKGERDCRILSDSALEDLKATYEAMKEHSDSSEAANIELLVLYECVRRHVSDIEAKKSELLGPYEALRHQSTILEAENGELVKKLCEYQLCIGELERRLDEMHSSTDEMASSFFNQAEILYKEVAERSSMLEQEWNSTVAQVVQTVGKLDAVSGIRWSSTLPTGNHDALDVRSRVAASVNAASKVIEDLQEKLEASSKDHEATSSLYNDMSEKFNELNGSNKLAIGVLNRIYDNLKKLVNESGECVEQSQTIEQNEHLFDPPHLDNYDTLMKQLSVFLGERLQLEYVSNKLNSELIDKAKEMEELKKRVLDVDIIRKLVESFEGGFKMEDTIVESDKLELRLQSLISFLSEKCKQADQQVSLSREANFSKELELSELQGQIDHLIAQHETEILVLKEILRQEADDLVAVRAELQTKVSELEESEQRVSSIREKLGIAVSKGKGLIVQRDSLKQSLSETSIELEKCSLELQSKDARLQEVETKLKTYLEAGERVEALESELSYIRNSATALRESFLLKDSVLQRIEEILEDLELPEHFHSRDIIEKVDWLARSVTGNSLPLIDWDQKSSLGGGSYSDTGFVATDAWKEDTQAESNPGDDLRRKFEELQNKFYGLAEQNEMLEQSLMERNNVVQRWEEILERINMPVQLRSMEPEDRIEWLRSALSEAHHHCNSLQQKVDNFQTHDATLTADLEESQRRLSDFETALHDVMHEKEHLSDNLESLTHDYDRVSEKVVQFELENKKLQNEVTVLQEKLVEKVRNQEHVEHIQGEIRRLEDLVSDVLQDSVAEDMVSGGSSTESLERLLLKLVEKCTTISLEKLILVDSFNVQKAEKAGTIEDEKRYSEDSKEQDVAGLQKELEDALSDLMCMKEERDRYKESNQSLVLKVEAIDRKRKELEELLSQEEQKSASVREKLNVAVRKGKSLVQQRDCLKQTIDELNNVVERLKSEIIHRESCISDYEQKTKELSAYQQRLEVLESESLFSRNHLAETEYSLQEKTHMLGLILSTLNEIDSGFECNISDPVQKLERIGKQCRDLGMIVASSEHNLSKSKRTAELLLAELNEVQERNDGLQEEIAKAATELSKLAKERDLAEAAKQDAFSRAEKLSAVHSEGSNRQFSELMVLKSCVEQLSRGFFDTNDLLGLVLSKDMDYLHNLEAILTSCLEPSEARDVVGLPFGGAGSFFATISENKEKFLATNSSLDSKMQEHIDDNVVIEIYGLLRHQLQDSVKEIRALKEQLHKHSVAFEEGAKHVFEVADIVHREVASQKQCFQSMKENIVKLECIEKEKDMESVVMRRSISLLYKACSSSIMEIETWKAQLVGNGSAAANLGMDSESSLSVDGGNLFSWQTLLSSEECIRSMADKLLSVVHDFSSIQARFVDGSQKEMKTTISNLQKELQEKEIQKDRICVELVSQIKKAEAAARNHLQDFEFAKDRLHDLERRLEVMEEERNLFEHRVKELQEGEANSKDLEERVRSLNGVVAAKEQEIEVLMQALDEEEIQMEDLKAKIGELEGVVQQKNQDLDNLETSRGKAMTKLSITVSKFDELHHLSANLLSEVEKLQSQQEERDTEISFLRQEVTRCTNDALVASQMSSKRNSDEVCDLLSWLDALISGLQPHTVHFDDEKRDRVHEYKEIFQKQIFSLVSELEDLRAAVQSRDMLLQVERSRVEELTCKGESLENSLREKESRLTRLQGVGDAERSGSMNSEIMEADTGINKWAVPGTSVTPQVRSLRKVNNDQVAIAIDMDPGSDGRLEDDDDDKAHGFKSLATSRIVPRVTRPVTDMIDGLWVSCDRALMRQPALRLGVIFYWVVMHTLLATFVV